MYLHLFIRGNHYSYQGPSAERILALAEAEEDLSGFRFTFRPVDGTVYQQGSYVPCGVLFRDPYLPQRVQPEEERLEDHPFYLPKKESNPEWAFPR